MNKIRGTSRLWIVIFGLWEVVTIGVVLISLVNYYNDPWRDLEMAQGLNNRYMQVALMSAILAIIGVPVFFVGRWVGRGFLSDKES